VEKKMIKRPAKVFLEVSVILVFGCAMVWAQATAQISGTIADQTGAVLPGVEVTATQTATGIARSVLSSEAGSYTLPNLPIGPYRLEAALPGFQTYSQTGIVLEVNSNAVINISLQVGNVAEKIEVIAGAALVETRTVEDLDAVLIEKESQEQDEAEARYQRELAYTLARIELRLESQQSDSDDIEEKAEGLWKDSIKEEGAELGRSADNLSVSLPE
jgi:hypothetical protein